MSVLIITTGGTIDKQYVMSNGAMDFTDSCIREILSTGRARSEFFFKELMLKDSLDMLDSDREQIAKACRDTAADRILITHGTDTMVETARFIFERYPSICEGKTVVLTGAMIPYRVKASDAGFNIGFALACAKIQAPGIYIAMNARILRWNTAEKNRQTQEFISRKP